MSYTALVTGASTGLGAEFCRQLSQLGVDLVLVARNTARLEALAEDLATNCEILEADLLTEKGQQSVANRLADRKRPIDILVNNAGFGIASSFDTSDIRGERRLHEILSWVPLALCHAAIPGMRERGRGWIINVASVAGLVPGGSYSAAKAGVISLSRSLGLRYGRGGINVTALCPGFTHTEFHDRMGTGGDGIPAFAWADARTVVREGIRAVRRGKLVAVSDWKYRAVRPLLPLVPRPIMEIALADGHRRLGN
ncbi:MAG TPA: SDR family NAD(P)-dependent oxidoreductase [Candidatus Agrococcus pullicola]|uniref:SDR family NAD(P)-dependent oxidoreductase n=1 Tax=Candidatus Agrococcus pullicola TaxID=2838429 RepID=A0A9D1YUI8_9MICO|nr:SDR family NAD(P)-dependent oxidoreductase [Candidatus Agrococcus pullicola]